MIEIVMDYLLGAWKIMLGAVLAALLMSLLFLPGTDQQSLDRGWTEFGQDLHAVSADQHRMQLLERGFWLGSQGPESPVTEPEEMIEPPTSDRSYVLVGTARQGADYSAYLIDEAAGFLSVQRGSELQDGDQVTDIATEAVFIFDSTDNELLELRLYGDQSENENEE